MRLPIRQRLLAGTAMLVFVGVFFVCPLHAGLTACTMPCCHPRATGVSISSGGEGCPGDCSIRADTPVTSAARSAMVEHRVAGSHAVPIAANMTFIDVPRSEPLVERDASPPPVPLHLLNSLFRI